MESQRDGQSGRWTVRKRESQRDGQSGRERESEKGRVRGMDSQEERERVREMESQKDGPYAPNILHVSPHRSPFPLLWYQHRACWQ